MSTDPRRASSPPALRPGVWVRLPDGTLTTVLEGPAWRREGLVGVTLGANVGYYPAEVLRLADAAPASGGVSDASA